MLFFAFLVVGAYAFVPLASDEANFAQFQKEFNIQYPTKEVAAAKYVKFVANLRKVERQNEEHIADGGGAVFGVTKFMDMTAAEFKAKYLTARPNVVPDAERVIPVQQGPKEDVINWIEKSAVTPVKDQGQCGSCWAFSAVDAVESYGFLNGSYPLTELSTQQVNACDKVDGGCNGGNTETAYEYIVKTGGLETNSDYPYTSGGGRTGICKFSAGKVNVKISGYKSIAKGEANVHTGLSSGPLSICVAAEAFQTYNSGILKRCPGGIDHCVQAVGYKDSDNYWLVRNSWGTSWGEKGLIRLEQGKNICKIGNDATYPTF